MPGQPRYSLSCRRQRHTLLASSRVCGTSARISRARALPHAPLKTLFYHRATERWDIASWSHAHGYTSWSDRRAYIPLPSTSRARHAFRVSRQAQTQCSVRQTVLSLPSIAALPAACRILSAQKCGLHGQVARSTCRPSDDDRSLLTLHDSQRIYQPQRSSRSRPTPCQNQK